MGSYINFKNFVEPPQNQYTVSKPPISTPLVRQSSIFELTFDEFQNTLGGTGKDFGSMNMEEFLKNIWTAEETQTMATSAVAGNLQRQGSLTLPRTLSQKTVDEVWREMFKENCGDKYANPPNLQQQEKQPTLGEVTLEEFLFRAGVVREEADNNIGFNHNQNNRVMENIFPMNMSGIRPSQELPQSLSSMPVTNNTQQASIRNGFSQGGVLFSGDKQLSPGGDTSALSPPTYRADGGGKRGRKGVSFEKATERRQKRMIKNRESAERSRARKQAYNVKLEAEVAELKELNNELLKKQDEIIDMQENQVLGTRKMPRGSKRRSLRRTVTGPW